MNELQKKLARRRCLNGEDGSNNVASSNTPEPSTISEPTKDSAPKLETRKSVNFAKKETPSTASANSSAAEELQRKLARRRSANGEVVNDETMPPNSSNVDRDVSTSSISSEVASISVLENFDPSSVSKEPETEVLELKVSAPPEEIPDESHNLADIPASAEDLQTISEAIVTQESSSADAAVEITASPEEPVLVVEQQLNHVTETEANVSDSVVESEKDTTKDIFKAAEDMMSVVDQELDFLLQSQPLSQISSQSNLIKSKKSSSDLFDDETVLFSQSAESSTNKELPSVAVNRELSTENIGIKVDVSNVLADNTVSQENAPSIILSPITNPSQASELEDLLPPTVAAPPPPLPPVSTSTKSVSSSSPTPQYSAPTVITTQPPLVPSSPNKPLPPSRSPKPTASVKLTSSSSNSSLANMAEPTSRGSLSDISAGKGSSRTSLTANDAPSTPTSSGSSDKWYPGKYLLAGRWGGSRHKIDMNKEQAQSLYNDLIATGGKGKSKSRQGSITGQLPQSLSAAGITASLEAVDASLASDLSTASLLAENHRLKQEISRLKRLLEEKEAIIDAYEMSDSLRSVKSSVTDTAPTMATSARPKALSNRPGGGKGAFDKEFYGDLEDEEDDDGGHDSGFEDGDPLFGRQNQHRHHHNHHRHTAATTGRSYTSSKELEKLLDFKTDLSTATTEAEVATENNDEDALTALLNNNGQRVVNHYDPRSLGNEADLVRSYNFSMRVTDRGKGSGGAADASQDDQDDNAENDDELPALSYESFLQLFAKSADLQFMAKAFILSVLGPQGDATPPARKDKLDYIFYGTHKLDERCRQFFDEMDQRLKQDIFFRHLQDEDEWICARDGFEQYVLHRIGQHAYKLTETVDEDRLLMRRTQVLSTFITPEHLEIPSNFFEAEMLQQAGRELKAINNFRTPGDKVACIVKCVTIIFRSLSVARKRQEDKLYLEKQQAKEKLQVSAETAGPGIDTEALKNTTTSDSSEGKDTARDKEGTKDEEEEEKPKLALAGADDFLPLFIWVVIQSKIPRLVSNCEYIHTYLNPKRLMSKSGYCLINLRSAIDFVTYAEASLLKIDAAYFAAQVSAAEAALPAAEEDHA